MISDIKNIWRQFARALQFQIVAKTATVFIIIILNNVKAAELASNIFVSLPVIGQKIHLSKSIDDPEIQLVAFDEEVKFPSLKASAGDDVLAYVGRRATLNGGLSQPEGRIGSRWIQISGPPVLDAVAQGPNLIVVVPAAGTYQFLLVVAEAGIISEPDSVTLVAVDHPEDVARQQAKQASPPAPTESVAPRDLIVRLTRKVLGEVPHSLGIANSLSELFADISQKMNLYTNYAEAHQEMSRRIGHPAASGPGDVAQAAVRRNRHVITGKAHILRPVAAKGPVLFLLPRRRDKDLLHLAHRRRLGLQGHYPARCAGHQCHQTNRHSETSSHAGPLKMWLTENANLLLLQHFQKCPHVDAPYSTYLDRSADRDKAPKLASTKAASTVTSSPERSGAVKLNSSNTRSITV